MTLPHNIRAKKCWAMVRELTHAFVMTEATASIRDVKFILELDEMREICPRTPMSCHDCGVVEFIHIEFKIMELKNKDNHQPTEKK